MLSRPRQYFDCDNSAGPRQGLRCRGHRAYPVFLPVGLSGAANARWLAGGPVWRQARVGGGSGALVAGNLSYTTFRRNFLWYITADAQPTGSRRIGSLSSGAQYRSTRWTIASERSRAISLYVSGASLGTIVALLASPIIVLSLGWPVVFYISGVLGLLWLAIWMFKAADGSRELRGRERPGIGADSG